MNSTELKEISKNEDIENGKLPETCNTLVTTLQNESLTLL